MSLTDPIADMVIRIKNAQTAKHPEVLMPSSKHKVAIAKVLQDEGYIEAYEVLSQESNKVQLKINLKYYRTKNQVHPVIKGMKRVSKPSLRIYRGAKDVPLVEGGYGIAIISTPHGVMSSFEGRKKNCGGEVICYVW